MERAQQITSESNQEQHLAPAKEPKTRFACERARLLL
jgi:hypothetical protein